MDIASTGSVAGEHRAVMRNGRVMAIAERTADAAEIVRALNDDRLRRRTAQRLVLMRDALERVITDLGDDPLAKRLRAISQGDFVVEEGKIREQPR